MRAMLVLYDSACPFCASCRSWLEARTHEIPLAFLCCRSPEARQRYGRIEGLGRDLVVIDDGGRYWSGAAAFVMCFWALASFRWLASIAASDFVWPITRLVLDWVSSHRALLGDVVGVTCTGEHCGLPPAHSPYR